MIESIKKRIIPGLIFGGVLLGGILFSSYSYAAVMIASIILCAREFNKITLDLRGETDRFKNLRVYFTTGISCLVFLSTFLIIFFPDFSFGHYLLAIPVAVFFVGFLGLLCIELFSHSDKPFTNIGLDMISMLYIGFPIVLSNFIVIKSHRAPFTEYSYEGKVLLGALLLVMMNDVGAFIAGGLFGKHKLFERISPKKTIEGTIGGFIVNIGIALLMWWIIGDLTAVQWIVMGLIASTGAVIGDLVESMFKRSLQLKDTGDAIPGHGGFLDRFDAILFSLPMIALYSLILMVPGSR
jgi:phosphatidate cytidylyltransferase